MEEQQRLNFHNTIDLEGMELKEAELKAGGQQKTILEFYRRHRDWMYTPFEIQERVLPVAPITSIRRAITNLTTMGFLIKCSTKRRERLGSDNYEWRYNPLLPGLPEVEEAEWRDHERLMRSLPDLKDNEPDQETT